MGNMLDSELMRNMFIAGGGGGGEAAAGAGYGRNAAGVGTLDADEAVHVQKGKF